MWCLIVPMWWGVRIIVFNWDSYIIPHVVGIAIHYPNFKFLRLYREFWSLYEYTTWTSTLIFIIHYHCANSPLNQDSATSFGLLITDPDRMINQQELWRGLRCWIFNHYWIWWYSGIFWCWLLVFASHQFQLPRSLLLACSLASLLVASNRTRQTF